MFRLELLFSRRALFATLVATLTATAAGAATLHRFGITQTTGSGGAQAVLQNSATGSAFQGEVGGSSPNTKVKYPFGVLGAYDAPGTTFGIGTIGLSTTGYAVAGESTGTGSAAQPSIFGYGAGDGVGVEGISTSQTSLAAGIYGSSTGDGDGGDFYAATNYGVYASSQSGNALFAISDYTTGGRAYLGKATGEGVAALGYSGSAKYPALTASDSVGGSDLLGTYSCAPSGGYCTNPESFIVQSTSANRSSNLTSFYPGSSDVQISGDLYVYGKVYQYCSAFPATSSTDCYDSSVGNYGTTGVTRSAGGTDVKVYGSAQSVRTVEDFGQAQLVNGRAYVRLDPAFARTTAPGAPYLVFVTPEGDSRGVFTANHTLSGFEVHENGGGRSSMTFDYRIVAKPLGDTSQRFVAVTPKHRIPGYNMASQPHTRGFRPAPQYTAPKPLPPVSFTR